MEDKKKNTNTLISNMWSNWCDLPLDTRQQVAEKLGVVGNLLSIAANVQSFATQMQAGIIEESQTSSEHLCEDEDIIEAEYEEVD